MGHVPTLLLHQSLCLRSTGPLYLAQLGFNFQNGQIVSGFIKKNVSVIFCCIYFWCYNKIISWFPEHTKLVFTSATCRFPAWTTIPLPLQMVYPFPLFTTFIYVTSSENPFLTNRARIATPYACYPYTCYLSSFSLEILYAYTHSCVYIHVNTYIFIY